MQKHFIYARSAKGNDDVATHPHRLAPRYRRFLMLVDGRRSVAELETVARPGEMQETLEYLLASGYIEKAGEVPDALSAAQNDDPFTAAALTPDMFEEFKRRAIVELESRCGESARAAIEHINAATTPVSLRGALREAEVLLANNADAPEVRELFLRIGRNLV